MQPSNANLTAAKMGMPVGATPAEIADMINWARSRRIGDPLHSEPRTIKYGAGIGEVLYITTNQGYLHAINVTNPTGPGDTSGGNEMFAFMPNQLLNKLQEQRADNVAGQHLYGLDGSMTTWMKDTDSNGIIDNAADRAYLFFGMRRGGGSYFAMDVTDPNAPRLMWQINAGSPGYELLGQSWSRMSLTTVDDGGTPRQVLIFGGGYDAATQDVPGLARDPNGDNVGMGIYIVDAISGALLNSVGADDPVTVGIPEFAVDVPQMKYSMPADIRTEDSNSNGITDRLYAVDTGGQIWRVDLIEGASISAGATINPYLFADLSGPGAAGNRRFFYPPSVAYTTRNNATVTALAIGSGYRAHPLDTAIDDQFYILFDTEVGVGPPAITPAALTSGGLYDSTANTIQTATGAALATELTALNAANGWRIDLPGDQKVLVRARIFRNYVFFNTFESGVADPCDFSGGTNRFYGVKLLDATGALEIDTDADGTPDVVERQVVVDDQAAILSEPTIVTHAEAGTPTSPDPFCSTVFAGSTAVMEICEAPVRVNWQTLQ
jgi:type IV pilus assembly protein PilY1